MRAILMLVALGCYLAFFASFVYLIGFVGNIPGLPLTVDRGPESPTAIAVVINLALIGLFGFQHSVMARSGFKIGLTRFVPQAIERSIFCFASAAVLVVLFLNWRPIPGTVWTFAGSGIGTVLLVLFAAGWGIVLISTFLLNHFELFGLAQPWRNLTGKAPPADNFATPGFYRFVRHPIYTGFLLAFWATPVMTYGHLVLAIGMTVYLLIGISYEEADLIERFGERYASYRAKVGMLIPGIGKRS
jgi:methanethiol S-methyltransferase